jgi:hypothetical protein
MIKLDIRNPQGLHLSESNFRKHEADIASFLRTFPAPIALSHPTLACSTYTAQLRNAINAHITKRFKSDVDPDVLREAWSKSVAIRSATSVTLGPKHAIRALTNSLTVETAASITAPNYLLELDSPTIDVLRALAYLYAAEVFHLPTKITNPPDSFEPFPGNAWVQRETVWLLA